MLRKLIKAFMEWYNPAIVPGDIWVLDKGALRVRIIHIEQDVMGRVIHYAVLDRDGDLFLDADEVLFRAIYKKEK